MKCQNTNKTKYKNSKIQTRQNTKGQNTNCQNTNVTRYKWNKIQKCQKTKQNKIQTRQNTKEQKTNCQNTNVKNINATKYKWNKIQIEQNAKIPKYKHVKIQIAKIQMQQQTNACATIFACVTFVRALVYCNFLREVRLGGWGSRGPKGPT